MASLPATMLASRVAAAHSCAAAPSELYVRVSPHTAQAFQSPREEAGFATVKPRL